MSGYTTTDLPLTPLADEVLVNRNGSVARQSIDNLAAQIWLQGDTDPISAATTTATSAAQTATAAAAEAEAARDATIAAGGWDYAPADLTALAAISGMAEGERAYVVSSGEIYRYDGAGWVATGENPLSDKIDKSDLTSSAAQVVELFDASGARVAYIDANGGLYLAGMRTSVQTSIRDLADAPRVEEVASPALAQLTDARRAVCVIADQLGDLYPTFSK